MRATKNTWDEPRELRGLRELSARFGSDRLLVQASSGNTSMKIDGTLWIKASGKWLIDADAADFLIPVQLARAKRCLRARTAIPEANSVADFRASIETAMHAILPQKVIAHLHSVNAVAWAVRSDALQQLSDRLSRFHWKWIPYRHSGADLAETIADVSSRFPRTNLWMLGNHGLVVCGESCDSTEQLLAEVERCLRVDMRPLPEPDASASKQSVAASGWRAPEYAAIQALATDPVSRKILSGGVLYPCQALFLPSTVRVPEDSALKQLPFFRQRRTRNLIENGHVPCRSEMTPAEEEMLLGLTDVVQRIHFSAPIRYLSFSEVSEILNVDSENYLRAANSSNDQGIDERKHGMADGIPRIA